MLADLFVHPVVIPFNTTLLLLFPLCAAVAIVYKTVRVDTLRRLPLQATVLIVYMLGGLCALGASLWALHTYWP